MDIMNVTAGSVIRMGENQDEYQTLPVLLGEAEDGAMTRTSFWKPNSEELEALQNGGSIAICIYGKTFPPILPYVTEEVSWLEAL